jgi:hypothetical protein
MSATTMTAVECFNSLTGFDEQAIKRAFGAPVTTLAEGDQMTFARSLIFVMLRREGRNDTDAKAGALEMTISEVTGFFADDDEGDAV